MKIDESSIEAVFLSALERPSEGERAAFLDGACGDDKELRQRLNALIQAHLEAGKFLDPPAPVQRATFIAEPPGDGTGTTIGPYKLREVLGEGGMGTVYAAEQETPVRRKVALKVIKPGMDSREVIARFEAERQALALMDHPNIAKVLEAGTTANGRPYFVMELVRGIPITDYCDKSNLPLNARLALFAQVCRAVQHAHQKGIIHRDLKPSNVLITLHDGVPVPKVIDFGVAKAINQKLTERTIYTRVAQMVGTPMYMSPEQAEFSELDVDTRSDVYSLGVMLYELLTGIMPFDKDVFSKASYDEIRRIIREDEPLRPSSRISSLKGEERSTASGKRGIDERQFSRTLAGELDWIVMRALEKDRLRRYESASAFAADIQRFLEGEPVEACPPSVSYRLKKYARKHRTMLVTVSLVLTTMAVVTAISTWAAIDANGARKLADERLTLANQRLKSEQKALGEANQQRERASVNLRQALDAVDKMLLRVADERLGKLPGAEPIRKELFQEALVFYEELFRQVPDDPQLRRNMAQAWTRVGILHHELGDNLKALDALKEATPRWEALLKETPDDTDMKISAAETYDRISWIEHWLLYRFASATPSIRRAMELWTEVARQRPDGIRYAWVANQSKYTLADNLKCLGQPEQAEATLRETLDTGRKLWDRAPLEMRPLFCQWLTSLAWFLSHETWVGNSKNGGDRTESEMLLIEAIRRAEEILSQDPDSDQAKSLHVRTTVEYANYLSKNKRDQEAIVALRHPIDAIQKAYDSLPARELHSNKEYSELARRLGDLLTESKNHEEALKFYAMASQFNRRYWDAFDETVHYVATTENTERSIANCLKDLIASGRTDIVRTTCEECDKVDGKRAFDLVIRLRAAYGWHVLGDKERSGKSLDAAMQLSRSLLSRTEKELPRVIRHRLGRAIFMAVADPPYHANDYEFALPLLDLCLLWTPQDAEIFNHRGCVHVTRQNFDRALEDLDESIRINPNWAGGESIEYRSLASVRLGQYERAKADLERGLNEPNLRVGRGNLIALISLTIGDQARYQKACRLLVERHLKDFDPEVRNLVIWTICLAPEAVKNYSEVIAESRRVATVEVKDPARKWHLTSLGALLMRSGNLIEAEQVLTEAVKLCPESDEAIPHCYAQFFLGNVRYQIKKSDAAVNELRLAIEAADQELTKKDVPIRRRLTLEWLAADAKKLIELTEPKNAAANRSEVNPASELTRCIPTDRALSIDEELANAARGGCGPDDNATASDMRQRGVVLKYVDQPHQALVLLEDTLERHQQAANDKLPEAIGVLINLGGAYILAREFDKGIAALQDAVTLSRTILGEDDRETLHALRRLAWGLRSAGRSEKEILVLEDALPRHRRILGSDDHETRVLINNLGKALMSTGRVEAAVPLLEEVVGQHRRLDGPQHRNTGISLLNLGQVLTELGQGERSIGILREALELFRDVYGENHPDTMLCLRRLASAYRRSGQPLEAVPLLKDVLGRHRRIYGQVDSDTIDLTNELAEAYADSGDASAGLALLESVLKDAIGHYGADSTFAAKAKSSLGYAYVIAERRMEGFALLKEAYETCVCLLGENDPRSIAAAGALGAANTAAGRPAGKL